MPMPEVLRVGDSAVLEHDRSDMSGSNFVKYYSVADRTICIKGPDEPILNLAHEFLGGYYITATRSSGTGAAPVHLIELHKTVPPVLPASEPGFEIEDGHCFMSGEQIVLEVNGSTLVVGPPETQRTDIWLSETTSARHELALNNVILYAVQAALRRAGLFQFHAGCVLPEDSSQAILIVGDSGSGKSTLTVALLQNGWRFVTDDNLLLSESPDAVEAWALRRYFTFDETTIRDCKLTAFPDSIGGRIPGKLEKFRFYARQAFPEKFVDRCVPGAILFPTISDEPKSRIEPLNQLDALTRLIRQCPWATCDAAAAPHHLQALSKLAKQTRSYKLFAGRDVIESPAAVAQLIKEQADNLS